MAGLEANEGLVAGVDVEDRAVGALVGLAAGDAVGTTLEFKRPGSFEPIADMVGGGPFRLPAGAWTDDTSMALCLAESLLDVGDQDPADQLRRYVRWYREGYLSSTGSCFDIGGATLGALNRFDRQGTAVADPIDQEAAANGSLMRLAPVAIRWWSSPADAAEQAAASSRTTHPAGRPVDACRVLGAMTAALIGGAPAAEVFDPGFWTFGPLHPEVEAVARGSWRGKEPPAIRGTGYCVDALEAALWAVAGADTFAEAVLRAANLGDDADTTAAIAGQLAGARWGASGVPVEWRRTLVDGPRIDSLARHLFHAAAGTRPPRWPYEELVHGWWADPVLAGEYPGHPDPARADLKLQVLLDAGVRTFVDLTTPYDGLEPYGERVLALAEGRGLVVAHLRFPIPDMGVIDRSGYDLILQAIGAAAPGGLVYVHCWGGIGRTGTVVGCLLVDAGATGQEALDAIEVARAHTAKARRPSPETARQRRVIQDRAG